MKPLARLRRPDSAFTMIEIAISLAVIGFALVAIIGILPIGMNVQKENREETIINQDYTMLMDAIRNGPRGMDDLTNYVMAITNYVTEYSGSKAINFSILGYNYTDSSTTPKFPLTNGYRIVGLLSTPKYTPDPNVQGKNGSSGFFSNYVVAYIRSMSGAASEKVPQTNADVQNLALSYRLITEVIPYSGFDTNWTNYLDPRIVGDTNQIVARSNYWMFAKNMQTNLHDVRLIFRWPLLPNGNAGSGRQVYRTMVSGYLLPTNDIGLPLYFFESRNYVKAQP